MPSPKTLRGFSLLEVMVALALLAIFFTSLILVQGRATNLAIEARNISIATQLARLQLMECKQQVQKVISSVSDFKQEGDFADLEYPGFKWECHAPKFNMKTPGASQLEEGLKKKTQDGAKKDTTGSASTISAPFLSMITDSLGDSVRELVVIIRWSDNDIEDELRVVTHVIDLTAMSALSRMLSQGAKTFEKNLPTKNPQGAGPPRGGLPGQPGAGPLMGGQSGPGAGGRMPGFMGGGGPPPSMRGPR